MLQKELIKRLKGKYETKMDDKGWLNVSSDGIPLCRVKYNGNCIINDDENLSDEYREKIADIQDEVLTVREYIGLYERAPQMKAAGVTEYKQLASFGILYWRQHTVKITDLFLLHGGKAMTAARCAGEITQLTTNVLKKHSPCVRGL